MISLMIPGMISLIISLKNDIINLKISQFTYLFPFNNVNRAYHLQSPIYGSPRYCDIFRLKVAFYESSTVTGTKLDVTRRSIESITSPVYSSPSLERINDEFYLLWPVTPFHFIQYGRICCRIFK